MPPAPIDASEPPTSPAAPPSVPPVTAPERGFLDYGEGDVFPGIGRRIMELIMKTERFLVFVDEFGGVQWSYSDLPYVVAADYALVSNRVARLETRSRFLRLDGPGPAADDLAGSVDFANRQHALFSARRLIAEGMARLLDCGSLAAANGMLDVAEQWIEQRSVEHSRRWLLVPFASLALVALTLVAGLVAAWGVPAADSPRLWVLGAALGGIGALVSSVVFNRKIPFDATAGRRLHGLEAALRFGVGVVAGLALQLLVQGDVFLGFLSGAEGPPAAVASLVLSLLAGSSELFFPTLLNRFEQGLDAPDSASPSP